MAALCSQQDVQGVAVIFGNRTGSVVKAWQTNGGWRAIVTWADGSRTQVNGRNVQVAKPT